MPFCNSCGIFLSLLDSRKLCDNCGKDYNDKILTETYIKNQRKHIERTVNFKILYYPQFLVVKKFDKILYNYANQNSACSVISDLARYPGQISLEEMNIHPNSFQKSSRALIYCIIGFILLFMDFPFIILSPVLVIIGFSLTILARRTEEINWRQQLALNLSIFYLVISIITLFILLFY